MPYSKPIGGIYVVESKQQQQQPIVTSLKTTTTTSTVIPSAISSEIQYVEMNNVRQQQQTKQQQQHTKLQHQKQQQQQQQHLQTSSQNQHHGVIISDVNNSMQTNRQTNLTTKSNNSFTTAIQQHSVKQQPQQLMHQQRFIHTTASQNSNSQNHISSHQQLLHVTEDFVPTNTTTTTQPTGGGGNLLLTTTTEGQMIGSQFYKVVDGSFLSVSNNNNNSSNNVGQKMVGNIVVPKTSSTQKLTTSRNISNTTAAGQLHNQVGQQSHQQQQQQPQTINFYSTKNVTYSSPVVSASPTPPTTTTTPTPIMNSSNMAMSNSRQKVSMSRPGSGGGGVVFNRTTSNQNQQQHQQQTNIQQSGVTSYVQHALVPTSHQKPQVVQKIMTRNAIPLITRVMQQPTSTNIANTSQSITTDTNHYFHQQHVPQLQHTQMLMHQTQKGATGAGSPIKNNSNNSLKKTNLVKHAQGKILQQGVKTFIQQQPQTQYQQQHQHQQIPQQIQPIQYSTTGGGGGGKMKSKVLKPQYGSIANTNGAIATITTLPQQQSSTTFNSNKNNSNQHLTATKITKYSNSPGKYVTINHHHQPTSHHVNTLPQGTHLHQKRSNSTSLSAIQSQVMNNSNVLGHNNNNNNNNNNGAGTIKFVNAHGTVVQQRDTGTQQSVAQQKLLSTAHRQAQQIQQHYQQTPQSLHFGEPAMVIAPETKSSANASGGIIINNTNNTTTNVYQLATTSTTNLQQQQQPQLQQTITHQQPSLSLSQQHQNQHQNQQHHNQQSPHPQQSQQYQQQQQQQQQKSSLSIPKSSSFTNDVMIVNGEQMTDEVSARILQSMAQKSYNNNQQRYQQQQHHHQQQQQHHQQQPKNVSIASIMPPPPPAQQIVMQQSPSSSSGGTTSTLLSPKEYQLFNASHQQSHTQTHLATDYHHPATSFNLTTTPITSANLVSFALQNTNTSLTYSSPMKNIPANTTSTSAKSQGMERRPQEMRKTTSVNLNVQSNQSSKNSTYDSSPQTKSEVSYEQILLPMQQKQQHQLLPKYINVPSNNDGSNSSLSIQSISAPVDDDIVGVEVRPVPVLSQDLRLQQLHAVLQDHTYAMPVSTHLPGSTDNGTSIIISQSPHLGQLQPTSQQQWPNNNQASLSIVAPTANVVSPTYVSTSAAAGSIQSYTLYGGQQIPRFPQDDDTNSAVSVGPRNLTGDIDPGEETETAAEADPEDDSVTRCVCDLTYDDGYMICCDKCSVWQHVDCMFTDRQNVPPDSRSYLCELCQPRQVDKVRARSLQMEKRRELAQLTMSAQVSVLGSSIRDGVGFRNRTDINLEGQPSQRLQSNNSTNPSADATLQPMPPLLPTNSSKIGGLVPKKGKAVKKVKNPKPKTKKTEKISRSTTLGGNVNTYKSTARKELKKTSKRKTRNIDGNAGVGASAAEKHTAVMRQWIENYECATTNHYSPELRARLHGITKQPSLLQSILNTENKILKECSSFENRVMTVPYNGSHILVSSSDVDANTPLLELRGKYMLTTQFKQQNPSMNMNNAKQLYLSSTKAHKTPGPFVFFYQLPGAEAPMQTMNPDGTYPPLPPQPAYLQGPEICVDTRTYGSEARFVRRSCRPNSAIHHLFEKGTIHLFIVSIAPIKAGFEITISHELHDLIALEKRKSSHAIIHPTSTAPCACGVTKTCPFGTSPALPNPNTTSKASPKTTPINGNVISAAVKQLTMSGGPLLEGVMPVALHTRTNSESTNRNRSTSSSGDSSIGSLNSPNIMPPLNLSSTAGAFKGTMNLLNSTMMPSSTSGAINMQPDSGICTSSSSTSVSLPSPILIMHSPLNINQHQQQQQHAATVIQQSAEHQNMLGALPPAMLLSPQFQQQQKQLQDTFAQQQSLAVIAAAAATQTPLAVSTSPLSSTEPMVVESQVVHLSPIAKQQNRISESETDTAENLAAVALQALNASTPVISASPTPPQTIKESVAPQRPEILQIQNQNEEKSIVQSPDSLPLAHKHLSPTTSTSGRKTPAKKMRTVSASEDMSTDSKDSSPTSVKTQEKKKLSREDRKMEAILRAIDKMERLQRRKEAKQRNNSHSEKVNNSSAPASPDKRTDNNASISDSYSARKNNFGPRKKRRKSQKAYASVVGQRKQQRKSFMNNQEQENEQDNEHAEEITRNSYASASNSTPSRNSYYGVSQSDAAGLADISSSSSALDDSRAYVNDAENQAAGLLIALSNPLSNSMKLDSPVKHEEIKNFISTPAEEHYGVEAFKSPQRMHIESTNNASPASVSSACLLIEAAMGPLTDDNTFKCPAKAKTKKSLVSSWLNQTEPVTPESPSTMNYGTGFASLVQAAMYQEQQLKEASSPQLLPENLSFAAKSVEEFIHQTTESSNLTPTEHCQGLGISQTELTTPPIGMVSSCTNNSSVKKRWLRQAISEETDEQPVSTAPTAVNGISTPLKKRLLVINNNGEDVEEGSSNEMSNTTPTPPAAAGVQDNSNSEDVDVLSNNFVCNMVSEQHSVQNESQSQDLVNYSQQLINYDRPMEVKTSMQSDYDKDQEDDVDILRSPSPGQKMIAEDNLVKILPEDISGEDNDVRIDVEHEESLAGDKFEEIVNFSRPADDDGLKIIKLAADGRLVLQNSSNAPESDNRTNSLELSPTDTPVTSPVHSQSILLRNNSESQIKVETPHRDNKDSLLHADITKRKTKGEQQKSLLKNNFLAKLNTTTTTTSSANSTNTSSTILTSTVTSVINSQSTAETTTDHTRIVLSTAQKSPDKHDTIFPKSKERRNDLTYDDMQERLRTFHDENILNLQARNKSKLINNKQEATPKNLKSSSRPLQAKHEKSISPSHKSADKQKKKERRICAVQRSSSNSSIEISNIEASVAITKPESQATTLATSSLQDSVKLKINVVPTLSTIGVTESTKQFNESVKSTTSITNESKRSKAEKRVLADDLNIKRSKNNESFDPETFKNFLKSKSKRKRRNTICESREAPSSRKILQDDVNVKREITNSSAQNMINNGPICESVAKRAKITPSEPLVNSTVNFQPKIETTPCDIVKKIEDTSSLSLLSSATVDIKQETVDIKQEPVDEKPMDPRFTRPSKPLPYATTLLPSSNISSTLANIMPHKSATISSVSSTPTLHTLQPASMLPRPSTISSLSSTTISSTISTISAVTSTPPSHIVQLSSSSSSSMLPPPPVVHHDVTTSLANASGLLANTSGFSQMQSPSSLIPSPLTTHSTVPANNNLQYYKAIYGKSREGGSSTVSGNNSSSSQATGSSNNTLYENLGLSEFLEFKPHNYGGYSSLLTPSPSTSKEFAINKTSESSLPSSSLFGLGSKPTSHFLTSTASKDPRLNPALSAPAPVPLPPVVPKRKLSISEYRKRMQQSSSSEGSTSGTVTGSNQSSCERTLKTDDSRRDSRSTASRDSQHNRALIQETKVDEATKDDVSVSNDASNSYNRNSPASSPPW